MNKKVVKKVTKSVKKARPPAKGIFLRSSKKNPKSEFRNPKKITNQKFQNTKALSLRRSEATEAISELGDCFAPLRGARNDKSPLGKPFSNV